MTNKFQNKYRIGSARLQNWDYGWDGAYFLTICTRNRQMYFGDVVKGEMRLSHVGILADVFWYEIKNHAKNVELDVYRVMPNHVHGILILNGNETDGNDDKNDSVEPGHALILPASNNQSPLTPGQQRFQNIGKNTVSSIIGSYKSAVTKHAHRLGFEFGWQSRFHDHIIRDQQSFERIRNYIINNPANWENDKFYKKTQ
jgi:putative transposase